MKKVHMICNAHIDPIWQWDWQEGVSAALSTFRSAANLADEFDYIFCHNEVTLYKYVEEYSPELFERIKNLVRIGKWRIMGGWYLQPDCNMPSGESLVRQALTGKEYFTEKFGVYPTTAINFDPFGHTKGLVQIIKKCGQDSYMFMRPFKSELTLPEEQFIWEGFAGTEIKATRTAGYNSPLGKAAENIKAKADDRQNDVVCVLWGVGNHGGGPSRKDLKDIEELKKDKDVLYVHSCPEDYFREITPTARFSESLHISMPGCYVSMGKVKRKHIKLENELYFAEKICSAAALSGVIEYPEKELATATEDLLNAEFHDTLPGSSIMSGEENALNFLSHGILEAERMKTRAFFALTKGQREADEGEYPILVFSVQPVKTKENVECEFMLADQNWSDLVSEIHVFDEKGKELEVQTVKEESNLNLDWRKKIVFEAELEPMKINRFSAFVKFVPKKDAERKEEFVYEGGGKRVVIDERTGLMTSYSVGKKEYLKAPINLVMMDDNADPWGMGAFQLKGIGTDEEPFETEKEPNGVFKGMKSVQVTENGDIYLGIEAFLKKDNTRARISYKIYKNNDFVDLAVNLFMGDVDKVVKLKIPTTADGKRVFGQTAFGEDELFTDGRENVSHRYVAASVGDKCFAVVNDCTYGSSFNGGDLYIPLTRGVTYCAHPIGERQLIPTDRFTKKIDQGENDFSFRLTAAMPEELASIASAFNQKAFALNAFPLQSEGKPLAYCGVTVDDKAITVEAFKKKNGGKEYVIRLLNNATEPRKATVTLCGKSATLSFLSYEVKTLLFGDDGFTESELLVI